MSHLGLKTWGMESCCLSNTKHFHESLSRDTEIMDFISKYGKNKTLQQIHLKTLKSKVKERQIWNKRGYKRMNSQKQILLKKRAKKRPSKSLEMFSLKPLWRTTNISGKQNLDKLGWKASPCMCINTIFCSLFAWISDAWRGDLGTKEVCLLLTHLCGESNVTIVSFPCQVQTSKIRMRKGTLPSAGKALERRDGFRSFDISRSGRWREPDCCCSPNKQLTGAEVCRNEGRIPQRGGAFAQNTSPSQPQSLRTT